MLETTKFRIGQSCPHVRPGNNGCLLYGDRLPFILRKAGMADLVYSEDRSVERKLYQMVGCECYVNDLVDGEGGEIAQRENI